MTHVSSAVQSGSGSTSIVINKPAVSVGDIVRVSFYFSANMTMTAAPAAMTLRDSLTGTGSVFGRYYTYWRRIDGTEGSTWTFTCSGTFSWRAIVQVVGGRIRTGDPYLGDADDSSSATGQGVSASVSLAGVTANCDLVCDYTRHSSSSATSFTPPPGMTEQVDTALVGSATQLDVPAATYSGKFSTAVGGTMAYPKIWLAALKPEPAPGVPTAVSAVALGVDSLELSWGAPASGGVVDHYEVRLDGGAPTTATSPHTFTGLAPDTEYDLEVRAVGPALSSGWVLVSLFTEAADLPTPPGYYRVELTIGSHSWTIARADVPAYGPLLPISLGWEVPDAAYWPSQASLTTLNLMIQTHDASELADVVKGTDVVMGVYLNINVGEEFPPWQWFSGVVTQMDGQFVPSVEDPGGLDYRVTVFAANDTARLADMVVGWENDWPIESIQDRLQRICDEAGIGFDNFSVDSGLEGWLAPRSAGAPMSALDAVRGALQDAATEYDSEVPDVYWGRVVYDYSVLGDPELSVYRALRRVLDGDTVTLDGAKVKAERPGQWSKQPGAHMATWGIVDDTEFGTPDGSAPFYVSTSLVDYFGDPPGSELNGSAATRVYLGRSLLADGSTALDGWSTKVLRYFSHLDPDPVRWWASWTGATGLMVTDFGGTDTPIVVPVVITPIGPELEVNAVDYLAGTLTGARLVIPPGGDHYMEVRLRSELLPGSETP